MLTFSSLFFSEKTMSYISTVPIHIIFVFMYTKIRLFLVYLFVTNSTMYTISYIHSQQTGTSPLKRTKWEKSSSGKEVARNVRAYTCMYVYEYLSLRMEVSETDDKRDYKHATRLFKIEINMHRLSLRWEVLQDSFLRLVSLAFSTKRFFAPITLFESHSIERTQSSWGKVILLFPFYCFFSPSHHWCSLNTTVYRA